NAGVMQSISFGEQLAAAGWAVWFYLYKAVLPAGLCFIYPRWTINPANPISYLPGILLAGLFLFFWRHRRGWGRTGFFCLGYYVVMLLPILGFMHVGFLTYSRVADHWQYFALIAPMAGMAGLVTARFSPATRTGIALMVL